ncbi:hypothetical protein KKE68_06490, partial [Patescibacteria group bacterium]|nr:hypothetical protein [Patescibacteria group bacterium]
LSGMRIRNISLRRRLQEMLRLRLFGMLRASALSAASFNKKIIQVINGCGLISPSLKKDFLWKKEL